MSRCHVNPDDPRYAKSSFSGHEDVCVELTFGATELQDTKNRGVVLANAPSAGAQLLAFARSLA